MTHSISCLPQLDQIIVMKDGQISEVGTYAELLNQQGAFSEFLMTYLKVEPDNEDEITEEGAFSMINSSLGFSLLLSFLC